MRPLIIPYSVVQPPFLFPQSADVSHALKSTHASEHHDTTYFIGACVALLCAIAGGFDSICIGGPLKDFKSVVLVFYVGLASLLTGMVAALFDPEQRIFSGDIGHISALEWGLLFGMALSGMFAYFASIKSLQLIAPTTSVVLRSMEIVFAYVLQILWMDYYPNRWGTAGSSLVFVSVVLIALENKIVGKMPSKVRGWL